MDRRAGICPLTVLAWAGTRDDPCSAYIVQKCERSHQLRRSRLSSGRCVWPSGRDNGCPVFQSPVMGPISRARKKTPHQRRTPHSARSLGSHTLDGACPRQSCPEITVMAAESDTAIGAHSVSVSVIWLRPADSSARPRTTDEIT